MQQLSVLCSCFLCLLILLTGCDSVGVEDVNVAPKESSISASKHTPDTCVPGTEYSTTYPECIPSFDISGTVFVDANENQTRNGSEYGLPGVTIDLLDSTQSVVASIQTDEDGAYTFEDQPVGDYTVRIPASTTPPNYSVPDFNERLASSFIATTPASIALAIEADSPDNDFGFNIDSEQLTEEFESGDLTSTAEDIKFWRQQVKRALTGKGAQNNAVVKKKALQELIDLIEGESQKPGIRIFLSEPFVFGISGNTGDEDLKLALELLNPPKNRNNQHQDFLAALLTAELNYVSGRDINNSPRLLESILAWAELRYANETSSASKRAPVSSLSDATALLRAFGGSGGVDN